MGQELVINQRECLPNRWAAVAELAVARWQFQGGHLLAARPVLAVQVAMEERVEMSISTLARKQPNRQSSQKAMMPMAFIFKVLAVVAELEGIQFQCLLLQALAVPLLLGLHWVVQVGPVEMEEL